MITYIYIVKCPNCEDEHFDFFDEAKEHALCCLSKKPIITQTEVCRNDFGECTDHCDLGTVWSWEDVMQETEDEPATSIFTKDDLSAYEDDYNPENDPEFYELDNSLDTYDGSYTDDLDGASDNFMNPEDELTEWVDSRGNNISIGGGVIQKTAATNTVTLSDLAKTLSMINVDTSKQINIAIDRGGKDVHQVDIKAPFSRDKMSYGAGFKFRNLFDPATHVIREIFNKIGVNLKIDPDFEAHFVDHVQKIWECSSNKDILLINYPWFHFIIDKNDLISQLDVQAGTMHDTTNESHIRKPIPEGMTIEQLVEEMEENEDFVECTQCNELFSKEECHKEPGKGWCCPNCSEHSESMLEELEDKDTYRNRLAVCENCGAEQAFDKETGFCLECGFNTL